MFMVLASVVWFCAERREEMKGRRMIRNTQADTEDIHKDTYLHGFNWGQISIKAIGSAERQR